MAKGGGERGGGDSRVYMFSSSSVWNRAPVAVAFEFGQGQFKLARSCTSTLTHARTIHSPARTSNLPRRAITT
jgi:hypothetical protein